ncbi:MAG: hypothetical protein AB7Q16_24380 [Vicinamibacterales bacterium]
MVDAGIGRLLIASLHQGIADVSPTRLEFYENWLSPGGLRDGRMGLAPLGAVLSFLNREEPPADRDIPSRAGVCAAEWAFGAASGFRKALLPRMPVRLRTRTALGMARDLVNDTISSSKVKMRIGSGSAIVEIRSPLFDYLRDSSSLPLRRYYASAYSEVLRLCGIDGVAEADENAPVCRLAIVLNGAPPHDSALLDVR